MPIQLSTQSVGDALVESLRERILTEQIKAGLPVTEAAVAREYDVARQTAKAAIERLVAEGLLERTAHKSARVPVLDGAQVRDLYYARGFIESACYSDLATSRRVTDDVASAHTDFLAAVADGDLRTIVDADVAFHRSLVASLDSPRLARAHKLIINEMRLCLAQVQSQHLLDPAKIAAEHEAILAAIRGGDVAGARQAGLDHLAHAESKLLDHLARRSGADHTV